MDDAGVYSNGLTGVRQVRMHAFEMIGTARFTGPRSLEVRLRDGGVREVIADKVCLNTGTRPALPPKLRRSRVLRRRGPFRARDLLVLPVVVHADLRACGLGSSAFQCVGGVECGDAPTDRRDQHHGRQHRDHERTVAEDCRIGSDRTDHAGVGQRPLSTQRRGQGIGLLVDYWCQFFFRRLWIIGVSSFFAGKRTDTNNPRSSF